MQRVLFIIGNLESGGVSKSLVSLLWEFDYDKYEVDLFIMNPVGVHMNSLPEQLNIITYEQCSNLLQLPLLSLKCLLKNKRITLFFAKFLQLSISYFSKAYGALFLSKLFPKHNKTYDLAIDFNGQQQLYYMVDKIKSRKKVTFFHSDYSKWSYYFKTDKVYFNKVDNIFSISDLCVQTLKDTFPKVSKKIGLMENISSLDLIDNLKSDPKSSLPESFIKKNDLNFVTVGHVSKAKGTDLAIETAILLKEQGIKFKWYFIGAVKKKSFYDSLVTSNYLQENIFFVGVLSNPYPYVYQCDIIVHPSEFEGKSIALDEAKLLCKPIVVTNFSTVKDQFKHNYNGVISNMNKQDLSFEILRIINDEELKNTLVNNLTKERKSNVDEVNKLYSILED
jgi:glycosyltransferase involved in cell wall biosynthesis